MELKIAKAEDRKLWDKLVEKSPQGTLFHRWDFLKIIEKHSKARLCPIIGMKGADEIGVYPLFYKKSAMLRTVFSPPPHVAAFYMGPALSGEVSARKSRKTSMFAEFQQAADDYISKDLKADYVSVHTVPDLDCRPLKWTGYRLDAIYNYRFDLAIGPDRIWEGFDSEIKRGIKKTQAAGVSVEEGGKEEVAKLFDLMNDRYEEQGKTVSVPKQYLLEVYDAFADNLKIMVAKYNGEMVSGVMDIRYKGRYTGWIGNPKTDLHGIYPNNLLLWESVKCAHRDGAGRFDIVGAAGIHRLSRYYEGFGPDLMLNFAAIKYNSLGAKAMEHIYLKAFKPARSKVLLMMKK